MAFEIADPSIQSSIIQSAGSILAAVIASVAAMLVGRQLTGRKRLIESLQDAVNDIEFLLAVESSHCDLHKEVSEESFKQRIRQSVRDRGFEWSGRFTPGRARSLSVLKKE